MQIAEGIDNTKAYVNHIIKRTDSVVNKTFPVREDIYEYIVNS